MFHCPSISKNLNPNFSFISLNSERVPHLTLWLLSTIAGKLESHLKKARKIKGDKNNWKALEFSKFGFAQINSKISLKIA